MLNKQSNRGKVKIFMDTLHIEDKEVIIKESENWNESQEILFKKMLQQGGSFTLKGKQYKVLKVERIDLDSEGNPPKSAPPIPVEKSF